MSARHFHPTLDLAEELDSTAVAMICGSGGVGKTSVAAAIATCEAMRGRKVCVLTIDPAKRLADALGVSGLGDTITKVKLPPKARRGGELHAAMLDPKTAFDRLISETAPSPEAEERVLNNRIYQQLSRHAAGMQEYMAIERLYEIDRSGRFDLIVVDTPPAAHARDLLEAPQILLRFIEGRSLRWFLKPGLKAGKLGLRVVGGAGGFLVSMLQRITGVDMIRDATEFFEAYDGMYETFSERIRIVERLLADPTTRFFVVTNPEREAIDEAIEFWRVLEDRGLLFGGSVANCVEPDLDEAPPTRSQLEELDGVDETLAQLLLSAYGDHLRLAERDQSRVFQLEEGTGGAPIAVVPRLAKLEPSVPGLASLAPWLYAASSDERRGELHTNQWR
jgi:anion-transporting  ArsA/GET3 family ATPase